MTVIKEFRGGINDVRSTQTARKTDVAAAEGRDHRAEFKAVQPEQMGGWVVS